MINITKIPEQDIKELRNFLTDRNNKPIDKKNRVSDFFSKYQELKNFSYRTKLNKMGSLGELAETELSKYNEENKRNFAWSTIHQEDLADDIWIADYSNDCVYIFELPQKDNFKLSDFYTTQKTARDNYLYEKKGNKGKIGADIVIDMTDDCFKEILTGEDFSSFLRAKLDFNSCELFIWPEKYPSSSAEYETRRDELSESLTPEQSEAATTTAKVSLVIAGAGCGKTRTLLGRINHLYKEGLVKSADDVLWVVFNSKNRREHEQELKKLDYSTKSAQTFHSLGYRICRELGGTQKNSFDPDEANPFELVLQLFEKDKYEGSIKDRFYKTLKQIDSEVQQRKTETGWVDNLYKWGSNTINSNDAKVQKLYEDFVNVAYAKKLTFFEKNNLSIDTYNYSFKDDDLCKLRLLNYLILNGYTKEDIYVERSEKFIQIVSDSTPLAAGTKLYWKNYDLENNFDTLKNSVPTYRNITENELESNIKEVIIRSCSYWFAQVAELFITLFKIYNINDLGIIQQELLQEYNDEDQRETREHIELFFKLLTPVYEMYEKFLDLENSLDFNDMINKAIEALKRNPDSNKFKYKYILVDEFQDVSYDTFNLVKTLQEHSGASIMCVGDDWQSIYSWKGSNLDFFTNFENNFGACNKFTVTKTHRYGQTLANVSGEFIMKNPLQIKKTLISDKHTDIIIWDSTWKSVVEDIKQRYGTKVSVRILTRNNMDNSSKTGLLEKFDEFRDVDILTIHKSKGLEADIVIVTDLIGGKFPSTKESDPVLQYFYTKYNLNKDSYPYSEERRLMYVAMTRAKKACYLWKSAENRSIFLIEIEDILKQQGKQNLGRKEL